jgi:hypothetical protein
MVKHKSDTRWPDDREVGWCYMQFAPCIRRRGAWVSWFSLKTKVDSFYRFGLKIGGYGSCGLTSKPLAWVFGLGLKIGSRGLVIWPTKLLRWFLGLCLKIMWAMIYRLCHKTDGRMKTAWDTRRDLGVFSLLSRLADARCGWCTWHHHGGHVKMKLKMDRSMW